MARVSELGAAVQDQRRQRFTEIIPFGTRLDFIRLSPYAVSVSVILVVATAVLWIARGGPRYGIDFAGGTMLHLRFAKNETAADVRSLLEKIGEGKAELQDLGAARGEFLIRLAGSGERHEDVAERVLAALRKVAGSEGFEVLRTEMVGPKVGKDLRRKAILAVIAATIMMGIYLTIRFELRYGIGAAVALAHDVAITVGGLLLLGYEFDLSVVAALLTIVGFSVNDTVVICDRIRENYRKMRREALATVANLSVNETLSRTIITTGTALLVTVALYVLGGSVIHGFAFALLVGFVAGTYSTVFIVTPVVLLFEGRRRR
jgi:preprotein translocase subunit SecF